MLVLTSEKILFTGLMIWLQFCMLWRRRAHNEQDDEPFTSWADMFTRYLRAVLVLGLCLKPEFPI